MADEPQSTILNRELATKIVAAYVRRNQIGADQIGTLISAVHQALAGAGKPAEEPEILTPAVPIRRSVQQDRVICLESYAVLVVECSERDHHCVGHQLRLDRDG
jgi:predicted transcriptional regulator